MNGGRGVGRCRWTEDRDGAGSSSESVAVSALHPLVDPAEVELIGSPERAFPAKGEGSWPCPICRHRQPFQLAYRVRVTDREPRQHERDILVCADCLTLLA
jgi:hypothetical protein